MISPQPTILLTGFPGRRMETDNFQNPTGIIARNLHGEQVGGYTIDSVVIDCELEERHQLVRGLFEKPRVLALSLGMASIKGFKLERTARNIIDTTNNPTQLGGPRRHAIRAESLDQRLCNINDSSLLAITKNLQRADLKQQLATTQERWVAMLWHSHSMTCPQHMSLFRDFSCTSPRTQNVPCRRSWIRTLQLQR